MVHLIVFMLFLGHVNPGQAFLEDNQQMQAPAYANVFVGDFSPETVQELKQDPDIFWWVQIGSELLVFGRETRIRSLSASQNVEIFEDPIDPEGLVFVRCFGDQQLTDLPGRILISFGPIAVMDAPFLKDQTLDRMPRAQNSVAVIPFTPNTVLVGPIDDGSNRKAMPRADIADVVAEVNATRWFSDVETLAGFDRYTSNPGILDARDWLISQFNALPGLDVSTQEFYVSSNSAYNVIAVLEGQTRPDDWYIVGAHYDATAGSGSPGQPAPGADDNASGTAGVLEMARIFTAYPTDATIIFICFSGEEQGLYGSNFHSSALQDSGDDQKVQGVVNMDMIGFSEDSVLDCLLETRAIGQNLMDELSQSAMDYTDLVIHTSLFAFGSDHVPYLNRQMPAVLTIEDDWSIYPYYHTVDDLPQYLVPDMAEEIIKMNVATIANLAGLAGSQASYGEYLEAWHTMPTDPRFSDANGNGFIDVTEILVFLD